MAKRKAEQRNEPGERASKSLKTQTRPIPRAKDQTLPQRTNGTSSRQSSITHASSPLNHPPSQLLDVYVFGGNSGGELGLGADATSANVKRPRLNPLLPSKMVGVVQVAVGGMHCVALTRDNKILTWGVNDLGALGRDTAWSGGLVDMDVDMDREKDDSESDDEGGKLNPKETTPTPIDSSAFPDGTVFVQVVAGDNASFALTREGLVYGWGTFNTTDGIHAFSPTVELQLRPTLIPNLRKVTSLAIGTNHVLALTSDGSVYTWGFGEHHQLGRRIVPRNRFHGAITERAVLNGLLPGSIGLSHIVHIGCGADHSFAVSDKGLVYSWGLNNYGQTGIWTGSEDDPTINRPTVVESLRMFGNLTMITGGNHHSVAASRDGLCLSWGRLENKALGHVPGSLPPDHTIKDIRDRPRILKVPTAIPGLSVNSVAAGSDHCIAISKEGKAYSWGFSQSYQTGLGIEEDVELPTLIDNTAVRAKVLVSAGAGGQFSVLAALPVE